MAHIRHSHLNRWCTHTVSISYIQDFLLELKNRKILIDTNLVHALSQKLESCSLHFLKNLIFQEQFNNTFCNIFITGSKVTVSLRLLTRHSVNLLSSQMYEYHFIRHFLPQILKLNAGLSLFYDIKYWSISSEKSLKYQIFSGLLIWDQQPPTMHSHCHFYNTNNCINVERVCLTVNYCHFHNTNNCINIEPVCLTVN